MRLSYIVPILTNLARYNFLTKPMKMVLANDGTFAYYFASEVLYGPFPEGEPAIASDDDIFTYWYARDILNDDDPKTWGERYKKEHNLVK